MRQQTRTWGGTWTDQKLEAFEKYVSAYLAIMNKHRDKWGWQIIYFDAFAGSGSIPNVTDQTNVNPSLFSELAIDETEANLYKGAAERVLSIEQRGFDGYHFIDRNKSANDALKNKLSHFKKHHEKMVFQSGDANNQIIKFAGAMKRTSKLKALVLLDPFGMQVDWTSLEQFKGTGVDLWIWSPRA